MINMNYGRLDNGRIVFAPLPLMYIDGKPIYDNESYINAGYKPIKNDYNGVGIGSYAAEYVETDDCILETFSMKT